MADVPHPQNSVTDEARRAQPRAETKHSLKLNMVTVADVEHPLEVKIEAEVVEEWKIPVKKHK